MAKKIISETDRDLFRQSIGDVHRISSDNILWQREQKPKPFPKFNAHNAFDENFEFDELAFDPLGIDDALSYSAPGIQKNVLKKLRKGYYGLDAELDLHGLTRQEAKRQFLRFLHDCVENGYRCVHIVHGKGIRSADNLSVLKNNLNSWLRQHRDVQAFCSSQPKQGGTGAVWVLLQLAEKFRQENLES